VRWRLDLLFYVNLAHHFLKNTGPMPDSEAFATFGFRSISVLIGWAALVLCASSRAPEFLREKVGKVTVRFAVF
jgi:putative endonuclease (uncharacterized protein DUF1780)